MSELKTPCNVCGELILDRTAQSNDGLCMPCSQGTKTVREDFDLVRQLWRRKFTESDAPSSFGETYERGEPAAVWRQLHALDLREGISSAALADIERCVRIAMRRVRQNAEMVTQSLIAAGYEFLFPEEAFLPPSSDSLRDLNELGEEFGPLPVTLRMFYEEVGSVDWRQSEEQLIQWADAGRDTAPELRIMGEQDPLVVFPPAELLEQARRQIKRLSRRFSAPPGSARVYCTLAPDECHKANYSGGENYNVYLPEPSIDFPLVGAVAEEIEDSLRNENQYPTNRIDCPSEFFVTHLQQCFAGGGFRGVPNGKRVPTSWSVAREIAARLLSI